MKNIMAALICFGSLLGDGVALADQIPLYPTGPGEDSAFLRFFNAGEGVMEIAASGSGVGLRIEAGQHISDFFNVPAGKAVKGSLTLDGQTQALDISVEPGEFATVIGMPVAGKSFRLITLREKPDDFNALKASLAFYRLDASCSEARVQVAGRDIDVFKNMANEGVWRRSINPLGLTVQLLCAGIPVGEPLVLGELAAGQRYSLFLVPSVQGPRLFGMQDKLAE